MKIYTGDCIKKMRTHIKDNSIDALITDPPAGIGFMGKEWDKDKGGRDEWIKWMIGVAKECYRTMKPGAHGLVWSFPRTSHWTMTALENAGFEIRDVVVHLFGSGFPKSHNVGKGYGTALKPAAENWVLIRKPISEKNIAENVLKWGCGAINIDACRVGTTGAMVMSKPDKDYKSRDGSYSCKSFGGNVKPVKIDIGRFPANVVLSCSCEDKHQPDCVCAELDEQSGQSKTVPSNPKSDKGGASRFFYCAKVSTKERNLGMENDPKKTKVYNVQSSKSSKDIKSVEKRFTTQQNNHPTVKPMKLMEYLITLITPPNGVILDPFMGSGSTGMAAKKLGYEFVGIEKEKEYVKIAKKRIKAIRSTE